MLGRHIILNRAIRENSLKRLQLIKHLENNVGIFGRGFKVGGTQHKDPKQEAARYV